jgi:hypothetical protein
MPAMGRRARGLEKSAESINAYVVCKSVNAITNHSVMTDVHMK